jgi:hypothetical protein
MELTQEVKDMLIETAKVLDGHQRRLFIARAVKAMGRGGQREAERELGWDRGTIRKGTHELDSGFICVDGRKTACGAAPVEERLPRLREDLKDIVDSQSQADPRFESTRLYLRLSVAAVVRQLIEQKGYDPDELPTEETIRKRLNDMGYHPRKVQKTKPKKKCPRLTRSSSGSTRSIVRPTPRPMSFG